ncbi:MAG TPA: type II toxin-antitoxin system VapC family toxin [Longimicrobiaceae bacterium]|nr:type II toxin-antitoxin system VapC family toxin [Longimicrobiaceae bacterium]
MEKFVLDTNIFIHAVRDSSVRKALAAWQRSMGPKIFMHAVVASELLHGARDEATWTRWRERWIAPAERVDRLVVPRYASWLDASRIVARLVETRELSGGVSQSFYNDCLIAASCREQGYSIVTHNRVDFELISHVAPGLRIAQPFP